MTTGLLDVSTLTRLPSQPSLRLTAAAAASWEALADDVLLHYGWRPSLTDAYRDYATQERIFRERYTTTYLAGRPTKVWNGVTYWLRHGYATAAVPGTSNHGRGDTVDVRGLTSFTSAAYREFAARAAVHGWSNKEGSKIGEPWHWQKVTYDSSPPTQEDDMPTIDEIGERMKEILRAPEFQAYFQQPTSVVVGGATMGPAPTSRFAADTRADVMRILDIVRGISAQITALGTAAPAQDVDAIAAAIADSLDDSLAVRVADLLSKRLAA